MKNACLFVLAFLCLEHSFAQNATTSGGTVTTGSSSFLCTAGSFTNTNSLNSATFKDYAHFSLAVGVGCSYWLKSTLNATAAAGTYAGFHIRASSLLNLLSGLKVETYLNGTLRESMSGGTLLNAISTGEGDVYFQTTKTYNETRLVIGGLASVAYELDIFYGFGLPMPPTGVVLPLSFTGFSAQRNAGAVTLSWSVNSDESLRTMEVEKSFDGRSFTTLASLPIGSTIYSYNDHGDAEAYYRIRVVTSARSYYSRVLHVGGVENGLSISCNNPVDDELRVTLSSAGGSYELKLATVDGRAVYGTRINTGRTVVIPRGGMQPGLYLLSVKSGAGAVAVKKIVFN